MPEGRLNGQVAVVTGAGRNIGRAIALLFAAEGAAVVVNGSRNVDAVNSVVEEIQSKGGKAIPAMADVSDPDAVADMISRASSILGPVDIVVNNVGVRKAKKFEDITIEDWRSTFATNLDSVFYLARTVLPGMRERRRGRIINISGYDGWTGHIENRAANIAAKAGMHGLTKAIAREYSRYGITVNTVAPGAIETERNPEDYAHIDVEALRGRIATRTFGAVDDIAEACLYLASPAAGFVTGQVLHVNGGEFMF
ncbi:acetoacetyl-CoA reductase/3-oxoacyl-[acyl-carrier protein] reductase [Micromonospora kangleipakensis]|uniref:Acetoacetyl-CoA reductase/3-oxoacyl-[acyl-carrier protein] reductase n=1 Tax=Micromonospora kangleipakensis TaxID=1077942 RepID=A0A4Q8BCU0_9ACTN|nr:SDR family oxidoreductase [Micromonospora kangleipakensis]RZU74963.1 acetoacetyl-CoA reductase/3-oxoacyl-[acyl-carrier protein] reductase [Micromonospora kangleipakensis]